MKAKQLKLTPLFSNQKIAGIIVKKKLLASCI